MGCDSKHDSHTRRPASTALTALGVALLLFLLPAVLAAQTYYSTIRGTATDNSGAVLVGLVVKAREINTGQEYETVTNEVGNYALQTLLPGVYTITAELPGFKQFVVSDIQLDARADRRVDVIMEPGDVTESITVTAGAQVIETERATLADTKPAEIFKVVPINPNYRSIWRMLVLSPTNVKTYKGGNVDYENSTYSIDGLQMRDGWNGGNTAVSAFAYMEAYREYKVEVAGVNASGATSTNVAIVSENGTNELHGEAWLHYNALGLNARPFFSKNRPHGPPIFRPNAKIGGPIYLGKLYDGRNKSFFHFSWQGLRGSQYPRQANFVVPNEAYRRGDFSSLSKQLVDPLTGQPLPGNVIPSSRISSVSKYFQEKYYPLPNSPGDRYNDILTPTTRGDYYSVRVDHRVSQKNSLFGRFLKSKGRTLSPTGGNNPLVGQRDQWRYAIQVVFSDTHVFSPTLVNVIRAGYSRDDSQLHGEQWGPDVVRESGLILEGLNPVYALPQMDIKGFNSISQIRHGAYTWSNYYLQETLSWTKGRHNFKFGMDWDNINGRLYQTPASEVYGRYDFNGRFSGFSYADFLFGIMNKSRRRTSVGLVYPHQDNFGFFVTDDFKVNPRLTLNFGLRYQWMTPRTVEQDLIANFDPALNALVVPSSQALSRVHPGFPKAVNIITADKAGVGRGLVHPDKNNFAPRFGFAWRPGFAEDFVIRGGAGIYYVALHPYIGHGGGAPFELNESFTNEIKDGQPAFAFPKPFPASTFVLGGTGAGGLNPYVRTPYSIQYTFTLEKQLGDFGVSGSYIGTLARKRIWNRDLNQPPANEIPYEDKRPFVPFPDLFWASVKDNGANHNYHALVAKVERRMARGFYFQGHFTWSKSMGDDWHTPEDAFNRAREYSQGPRIPHTRTVFLFVYELPFGRGKHFGGNWPKALDLIAGGWNISGTWVLDQGRYFHPTFRGRDPSNTNKFSGRADRIADGNLSQDRPKSERLAKWFDTSAFVAPPAGIGRFGTSGAYVIRGPGMNVFHFYTGKDISFTERVKLRLEAQSTNFLNHPQFNWPGTTIGTSSYGRITSTNRDYGSRWFQFTVRLSF